MNSCCSLPRIFCAQTIQPIMNGMSLHPNPKGAPRCQISIHSVEIVEKHHAHGVDKRRQTSPQNVRTKNSFQIHLLSRLHQVQTNFTENEVLLQKVDVKHHYPKIIQSPCFCIQIQMSSHRSASFPEFCPTVLSKTSNHSHHASYMQETQHMPTVCTGVYISITAAEIKGKTSKPPGHTRE